MPSTHRTDGEIVHDVDPGDPAGYPAPSVQVTGCESNCHVKPIRAALKA